MFNVHFLGFKEGNCFQSPDDLTHYRYNNHYGAINMMQIFRSSIFSNQAKSINTKDAYK